MRALGLLGLLGLTVVLSIALADGARAEPPRRDPVQIVTVSELIVVARVVEVHTIATPHEGYGLDEVEIAEIEIQETWKGDETRKRAFFLASPRWTCDVSRAEKGETGAFFLRSYDPDQDHEDERALRTQAFDVGVKEIVGEDVLSLLVLSGAGRMLFGDVAGTTHATVPLAWADELLPYLWSTWGDDPRWPSSRLVEVTALRALVMGLTRLPEGEDFRRLFSANERQRWDAIDRLLKKPDREALVAIALVAVNPHYDDELMDRAGPRLHGRGAEVWAALRDLGRHPALLVRVGASRHLAWADDHVPLRRLLDDADVASRCMLARALIRRGRHSDMEEGDVELHAALLADTDAEVRRLAVTAYVLHSESLSEEVPKPLFQASRDGDARVRRTALFGLGNDVWYSGLPTWQAARDAIGRGLVDEDVSVRRAASGALLTHLRNVTKFGPDELDADAEMAAFLVPAAGAVRKAVGDADPKVRGCALAALGGYVGEEAMPVLRDALRDESAWIRRCAASGLGWVESDAAVAALASALKDADQDTQVIAVQSLERIATPAAVAHLLSTMKSAEGLVRWMAIESLGETGGEGVLEALLQAVLEGEPEAQWRAAIALGDLGIESAPALVRAAREADTYGAGRAVYALRRFLWHDDPAVRLLAVHALAAAGADGPDVIRSLERLGEDDSAAVRVAAAKLLEKLHAD